MRHAVIVLAMLLCSALPTARAAQAAEGAAPYLLGPEDRISILIARHPEWSQELIVVPLDGKITLPVVGTIDVTGLSSDQVRQRVEAGLSKRLVRPEVSVTLREPRQQRLYVGGPGVKLGGVFGWRPGWRVTQAIAEAQGLREKPERHVATLFRQGRGTVLNLERIYLKRDPDANLELLPGDILDVQLEPTVRVYVGGAVKEPQSVEVPLGGGIQEAITLAGGLLPTAVGSRVSVMRAAGGKPVEIDVNALSERGRQAEVPKLEVGDVIHVPENRATVAVLGCVKKPDSFPMRDGKSITLLDAIAMAGGFLPEARSSRVVVQRVDGSLEIVNLYAAVNEGGTAPQVELRAGDVVKVPENTARFSVFGNVKEPGTHVLPDGRQTTVLEAVSFAHGFEKDAEKAHVGVIRGAPAQPRLIEVDIGKLMKAARDSANGKRSASAADSRTAGAGDGVAEGFILQDGDVVVVLRKKRPEWATILSGVQNVGILFLTLL
jgi:polysaccharide biosynthesis/export protein